MKLWLLVLTSLIVYVMVTEEQHIKFVLRHCSLVYNTKFYDNGTSTCKRLNRTTTQMDFDMYIRKGIVVYAPLYIRVTAYKKFGTMYRASMVDINDDYCSVLSLKSHPLLKLVLQEATISNLKTNIFDPCPISGHRYIHYITRGVPLTPILVPVGQWRVDFIVSAMVNGSNEEWFTHRTYFDVSPTSATEF